MIKDYVYTFSPDNKPVKTVKPGEKVSFSTLDCFSNQVRSEDQLITSIDFDKVNPATGPVFVEGAKEGDVLVVDILSIDVEDSGVVSTLPGTGPLYKETELRTKKLSIEDGFILFNDVKIPLNPMVGVIGVSPKTGDVPCGFPGAHGGNMDCNKIVENSRLYFPVNVDGALFQLGDLHASMGDGEISGTGVEIPGEVKVKLSLIKEQVLDWPVLETEDMWYAISSHETFEEALKYSTKQIQDLITEAYDWDKTDAYLYMSAIGSFEICQGCKPSDFPAVVRFGVPKIAQKPKLIKRHKSFIVERKLGKILVPIDGSGDSKRALLEAKKIAESMGGSIALINVANDIVINSDLGEQFYEVQSSEILIQGGKDLLERAKKEISDFEGEITSIVRTGNPANEIIREVESSDYDLIIMGSRGLGAFSRAMLGSVSQKVLNHVKTDVLIMK